MLRYNNQANHAYFDHIQLIKDVAQTCTYDNEGNPISVKANAEQKAGLDYYDNNDLKSYTDAAGNKTQYSYDSNRNLKVTTSPRGVKTENTYSSSTKNITAVETKNASNELVIKTGFGYNSAAGNINAGSYVTSVSDEHGNTSTAAYDYARGRMTSQTDANGYTSTYSYVSNNDDRIKSVTAPDTRTKAEYTYTGNRLSSILFGSGGLDENYSFTYDSFGNRNVTKVNNAILSTNTYAKNGALQKIVYYNKVNHNDNNNNDDNAADHTLLYFYDKWGNTNLVKSTKDGDTVQKSLYSWGYDSTGTTVYHRDAENNTKYLYTYDSLGRLIRQDLQTNDTFEHKGSTEFTYDIRNNLTKLTNEAGGRTVTQQYSYSAVSGVDGTAAYAKDNLPTRYKISGTRYVDYTYDTLNRLNKKALALNNTTLCTNYVYYTSHRNTSGSTLYRTHQLAYEIIGDNAFKYSYDDAGNITAVQKGIRTGGNDSNTAGSYTAYTSYKYNNLNELKRENNTAISKTYTWSYDRLGNIKERREYTYSTADTLSTPTKTVTYRYGNDNKSGWDRLLTDVNLDGSYDDNGNPSYSPDEKITYNGIGNPVTYLGASLTWFGRQLKSYKKSGTTINYKYDADGLRASKTVGSNKTTYQYLNGQLVYENRNGTDIFYYYDSYGHLTAIKYYEDGGTTATMLYVATNSFGDVIGLYSGTGSLLVKYEYDAWGNIISETNASGGTLSSTAQGYSDMCAIRYRGYYYDKDTGLYYLQSRYYNPEVGRFLNADSQLNSQSGVLGYNVFAYCQNNPVMFSDSTGHIAFLAITGAIGAVAGGIAGGIIAAKQGKSVLAGIGIGAAAGGLIGLGAGAAAGALLAGSATASTAAVLAGGSGLVAAVSTGGLGAGASYIANNVSQAGNNTAPVAQTAVSKMADVVAKGKAGEALSGITKNTAHISSLTGTASYRIPDGLDTGMRILSEVKNYSGTLSYTNQLKDFVMWSQANGYKMQLYTNAPLTGPLLQLVDSDIIQLFPLG